MSHRSTRRRFASTEGAACEMLERRRLLSTYVINGTNGSDSWHIEARPGQVFIAGQGTINNPSITDVQVNGFNGADLLVINHASIPVVFNAGDGDNRISLTSGLMSGQITAPVTFNAGYGGDVAELRDEIWPNYASYSFTGELFSQVIRFGASAGALHLNMNLGGNDRLELNIGPGGSSINFDPDEWDSLDTTINGGNGPDSLYVDLAAMRSYLHFYAGGGSDTLQVDARSWPTSSVYEISEYNIQHPGPGAVSFNQQLESASLAGSSSASCTYDVTLRSDSTRLQLAGGNASDTFNLGTSTEQIYSPQITIDAGGGNDAVYTNGAVIPSLFVRGGSGFNWLTVDDRTLAGILIDQPNVYADRISRGFSPQLNVYYDDFASVEHYLPPGANSVDVFGISSDISPSASFQILGNTSDDEFNIFPRDSQGSTINGQLALWGGGGQNTVSVWDTGNTQGSTFTLTSPNSGMAFLTGVGTGNVGVGNDVQHFQIRGGPGNNIFNVQEFRSGSALAIYGGGGNDTCTIGNGDMSANLTNCAAFTFDGQAGSDRFTIANGLTNTQWNYTTQSGSVTALRPSTGYSWHSVTPNIESQSFMAGSAADWFNIDATAPGLYTECNGFAGTDQLRLGTSNNVVSGIRGKVAYNAGADGGSILVASGAGSPSTVHLDASTIGAYTGDTLFGVGGSVSFTGITNGAGAPGISMVAPSGSTVYAQPLANAQVQILSSFLFMAPSGSIKLALGGVQNPVINGTSASGSLTSSNRQTLTWDRFTGSIETDSVAPAMISGDINLNGIPGPGDGGPRRQAVSVRFTEDVSSRLDPSWLQLTNLTTNQLVPTANIAVEYEAATNTAHFTFPGYPLGILPDGDYSGKILAGLPDFFGNGLPADAPFSFFFLQGDANQNRRVNLQDFNILAANFGQSNRTFSQGDFNYDTVVNLQDFNILAARFGASFSPMSTVTAAAPGFDGLERVARALARASEDDPMNGLFA